MTRKSQRHENDFEPEKLKSRFMPSPEIAWWVMFFLALISAIAGIGAWIFPLQ